MTIKTADGYERNMIFEKLNKYVSWQRFGVVHNVLTRFSNPKKTGLSILQVQII